MKNLAKLGMSKLFSSLASCRASVAHGLGLGPKNITAAHSQHRQYDFRCVRQATSSAQQDEHFSMCTIRWA
jgi:hypothetical protein